MRRLLTAHAGRHGQGPKQHHSSADKELTSVPASRLIGPLNPTRPRNFLANNFNWQNLTTPM